jgi:hypothetical protein
MLFTIFDRKSMPKDKKPSTSYHLFYLPLAVVVNERLRRSDGVEVGRRAISGE